VYWNATTQQAIYFGDERHGITLDWQTHEYLHRTRGAAIANGFLASGYTLNNSATDAATQIAIESGTFFDEDMKIDIVSTATPTAGTYQQNLLFPAKIPVLHLQGTSWVMDAPTDFPFKQGTSRPQYNSVSGGVWSTADVGNNQHATTWILATNNLTYPVIAIIGQSATDNLGEAEAFSFADLTLIGFPSVEFRPLYKLIYKASNGYANSVNAQLVSIIDLRSISAVGSAANPATDHGNLSGLSDDDHPQYVHTSEVRTPSAAVKNSFFPSQVGQTGKFLSTDGTNTVWEPPPSGSLSFTGDVTGSGSTGSSVAMTLAASGVVAGQYTKVTVDSKGRVTAGTGVTSADVTSALGYTPYNATNPAGYTTNVGTVTSVSGTGTVSGLTLTGSVTSSGSLELGGTLTLTSGQVTTALGYTPYNSTNPSGYITSSASITGNAAGITGYTLESDTAGASSIMTRNASGDSSIGSRFHFRTASAYNAPGYALIGMNWGGAAGTYRNFAVYDYVNSRPMFESFGETRNFTVHGALSAVGATLTSASTVSVSTWEKWTLETTGVTAKARQGSDTNGLNFTSNARWTGSAWAEDDTARKKFAYIQHLGNGRHEFRTSPTGAGVSWTTSFTIDDTAVNSTVALTQGGNQVLHAGNVSTYALPITGGTLTGLLTSSVAPAAINTTTPGTSNYGFTFNGASSPDNAQAITWSWSSGGGAQAGIYVQSSGAYGTRMYLATTDSFASGAKTAISIDESGNTNIVRGALRQGGNQVLHAGNYTAYSPSLTGSGASGTWGISINGASASAASIAVADTRSSVQGPQTGGSKVRFDFLANTTDGLADGGNYHGVMTFQQWADASGGGTRQLGFTDNDNLWIRGSGSGVSSYGSWKLLLNSSNIGSYALPIGGGTLTGSRPIQLSTSDGAVFITAANGGGWSMGTYFKGSSGTIRAGFGALGSNNDLTYAWIGTGYENAWLTLNGSAVNSTVALQQSGNQVLHAGNYTSYSPSLTGSGASGTWGISVSGNAATVSSITGNTGLMVNRLTPTGAIDGLTSSNFRTTLFGSGGNAEAIATARWNTPPSALSGLGYYGTMIAWAASDTHGFLALDYVNGNARIGGGSGQSIHWGALLLHSSNYTNYSPSLTGSGASGTWSISTTSDFLHSDRDFPSGTLITTDINYAVSSGDPFVLEIRGNSYGNIVPLDIQYQGYIYSDTIINHGGLSNGLNISGLVAINNGGNLCFWFPSQGYWNGYYVKVYVPYSGRLRNRVTSITGAAKPTTAKEVGLSANIRQSLHSGNYTSYSPSLTGSGASGTWGINITGNAGTAYGLSYAQLFNNAGNNHGSWSDFNNVPGFGAYFVQGNGNGPSTANQYYSLNLGLGNDYAYSSYAAQFAIPRIPAGGSNGNLYLGVRFREGGSWGSWYKAASGYSDNSGQLNGYSSAESGASVVLRTASNGYLYVSNWINTGSGGIFSSVNGAHWYPSDNSFGAWKISGSRNGYTGISCNTNGGPVAWMVDMGGNLTGFHNQDYGWQMYWSGGSLTVFKNSSGGGTGATVLDASNYTSYSPSIGSTNTLTNIWYFRSNRNTSSDSPPLQAYSNDGGGAIMSFHRGSYYAVNMGLDSDNVFRIGGWSAATNRLQMDMSGNLTMAGNVTAYSDERLKKDWSPIYDGFVDRLASILAGTYTRIDSNERQAGVSAQAMREILPEVVSADNEGTLALAYGNAAMVSAVELAKEMIQLKRELAELKSRLH
jgi:hypothetical protein